MSHQDLTHSPLKKNRIYLLPHSPPSRPPLVALNDRIVGPGGATTTGGRASPGTASGASR